MKIINRNDNDNNNNKNINVFCDVQGVGARADAEMHAEPIINIIKIINNKGPACACGRTLLAGTANKPWYFIHSGARSAPGNLAKLIRRVSSPEIDANLIIKIIKKINKVLAPDTWRAACGHHFFQVPQ